MVNLDVHVQQNHKEYTSSQASYISKGDNPVMIIKAIESFPDQKAMMNGEVGAIRGLRHHPSKTGPNEETSTQKEKNCGRRLKISKPQRQSKIAGVCEAVLLDELPTTTTTIFHRTQTS